MRVPVNTFKVVCDGCGQTFHNSEDFICYCDCQNQIEDEAVDSGWLRTNDGHHYCPDCYSVNDNDEYECKDGLKYNIDREPIPVKMHMTREEFQEKMPIGAVICAAAEYEHAIEQGREPIMEQVFMSKEYNRKHLYQIGTYGASSGLTPIDFYYFGVQPNLWKNRDKLNH